MTAYIITYDLNKESTRPPIVKNIKSYDNWAILSESSYAINTNQTPKQVFDFLAKHLDGNDNLYVIKLTKPYYGQGPEKVNKWLESNLV